LNAKFLIKLILETRFEEAKMPQRQIAYGKIPQNAMKRIVWRRCFGPLSSASILDGMHARDSRACRARIAAAAPKSQTHKYNVPASIVARM
jgi:hypothetical protein